MEHIGDYAFLVGLSNEFRGCFWKLSDTDDMITGQGDTVLDTLSLARAVAACPSNTRHAAARRARRVVPRQRGHKSG